MVEFMKAENNKAKYSFVEKCMNKLRHSKLYNNSFTCSLRRKKLNNTDFTIISNNCWGGICYEFFGLKKLSPTVGCYFFSSDYLKFVGNLRHYLSQKLVIISAKESVHYESLLNKNETNVPVGRLDDIEVVFLHYRNADDAVEKWNRRCKRINWNNLIIKYSNMNEASQDDVKLFLNLEILNSKKLCFLNYTPNQFKKDVLIVVSHILKMKKTCLMIRFIGKSSLTYINF